jgi:hypothetical protein
MVETLPTYKYSNCFIKYDNKEIQIVEKIEEQTRILIPPNYEEYPYMPYECANIEELEGCTNDAKKETIESLYQKALSFVETYNDQDDYKQILMALDIIWSYFQDRFSTTHYEGITGDNDSGKSTVGGTFEAIAYRCVNTTSPSAANIFRILGTIEPGQCTMVLDESDNNIDESPDMMAILKTGYDYLKKVPKTNTNT